MEAPGQLMVNLSACRAALRVDVIEGRDPSAQERLAAFLRHSRDLAREVGREDRIHVVPAELVNRLDVSREAG
jgi:hypothetical protein